ncbi:MAG: T9SS type A sorting domain-containing protein [Bacteroidia bacterium]|nr:T9SS type A sorting domain-containing protein [Bacteroidia bacterium]
MKKILLSLVASIGFSAAQAQCTPDPALNYPGIYPNKLPNAVVGEDYSQVISLKVPLDTSIVINNNGTPMNYDVTVDSASVISIENVPAGFGYEADKPTRTWVGGSKGCARLYGKAVEADAKDWVIWVKVLTYFKIKGLSNQFTRLDSSSIDFKVVLANGLFEAGSAFRLKGYPNPANNTFNLQLAQTGTLKQLSVYNAMGQEITVPSSYDSYANQVSLNTESLTPGVYLIKVSDNQNRLFESRFIKQ